MQNSTAQHSEMGPISFLSFLFFIFYRDTIFFFFFLSSNDSSFLKKIKFKYLKSDKPLYIFELVITI